MRRSDRGVVQPNVGLRGVRALVALALFAIVAPSGVSDRAFAQTPPTERELRIYAGLHAAAADGVAAYLRRHDAARALLRLGADPNALDAERYDVVTIAAVNDDLEMLNIALAAGANARAVTSPYAGTALIAAAHRGHVEIVRALIAAKAPLNHVNDFGWTALLEAVVLGNGSAKYAAVVDALVKAGADVNIADRHSTTALGHAHARGYSQIARILENAGGH